MCKIFDECVKHGSLTSPNVSDSGYIVSEISVGVRQYIWGPDKYITSCQLRNTFHQKKLAVCRLETPKHLETTLFFFEDEE
jgi:hypothetical protein